MDRRFLHDAGRRRFALEAAAGLALLGGCASTPKARGGGPRPEKEEEKVSAIEDLMREHGVLRRVLLVYEECARRLAEPGRAAPLDSIGTAASMVRRFVEGYHEKLEEDHLFPRFEAKGVDRELVATLRRQHDAGRRLTKSILVSVDDKIGDDMVARQALAKQLRDFTAMYRPHAAREDTVLFPALHEVVGDEAVDALGEKFEKLEHQMIPEGFQGVVASVARLEDALGIGDLDRYTPR